MALPKMLNPSFRRVDKRVMSDDPVVQHPMIALKGKYLKCCATRGNSKMFVGFRYRLRIHGSGFGVAWNGSLKPCPCL